MTEQKQQALKPIEKINNYLLTPTSVQLIGEALRVNSEEKNEVVKEFVASIMNEISRTIGGKGDLTQCTETSIRRAVIDSVKLGVQVDKRQHAHLVPRGRKLDNGQYIKECQLEIGYRGFLATLKEKLQHADFTVEPVYEGDELDVHDQGGFQTYTMTKRDPFRNPKELKELKGMLFCVTYTQGQRKYSKLTLMGEQEIQQIKSAAQQDFVWKAWPVEMRKKTIIKRGCKIHFNSLTNHLDVYDNQNYDLEKLQEIQAKEAITTDEVGDELADIATNDEFTQDAYDIDQTQEEKPNE